jgi:hypothetical protein
LQIMESTETIFLEMFAYRRFFWCYHFYSNNHEYFHKSFITLAAGSSDSRLRLDWWIGIEAFDPEEEYRSGKDPRYSGI